MYIAFGAFSVVVYNLMMWEIGVVHNEDYRKAGQFSETESPFTFFIPQRNPH